MKLSLPQLAVSVALVASVASASVLLDIQAYDGHSAPHPLAVERAAKRLARRTTLQADVFRELAYYQVNAELGSPPQKLSLLLDTGSSDLWVLSSNVTCLPHNSDDDDSWLGVNCSTNGIFDSGKSSTFKLNASANEDFDPTRPKTWPFQISYGDKSGANGFWATETLTFGNKAVSNLDFGFAQNASSGQAVLGIGPVGNEASADFSRQWEYPNLPQKLKLEGLTSSTAYSLWLNSQTTLKGNILFGGYDRAKLASDLFTLPLQPTDTPVVTEYAVNLIDIEVNGQRHGSGGKVVLDSGTTMALLPSDMIDPIIELTGAQYMEDLNSFILDCDKAPRGGNVTFNFGEGSIVVQLTDLISVLRYSNGSPGIFQDGSVMCTVNVQNSDKSQPYILGASFLRSAYVVYDIDNGKVSLANAKFDVTASDIVEIGDAGVNGDGEETPDSSGANSHNQTAPPRHNSHAKESSARDKHSSGASKLPISFSAFIPIALFLFG